MPGVYRAEKVMWGLTREGEGYMFSLNRSQKWKFRIEGLAQGGRYVMGSRHTVTPTVKPENFVAMVEATLKYGAY